MYLGFHNFYTSYNGNRMFMDPPSPIGDDLACPTVYRGQQSRKMSHQCATIDTDELDKFDAIVSSDHPNIFSIGYIMVAGESSWVTS